MNTNNTKILSKNPKSIITNSSDKARSLYPLAGFRGGYAKNLFNNIENLKLQSSDLSLYSLTTDNFANYIESTKLTRLESKNNVESNLNANILKASDLLTGTSGYEGRGLTPSGSNENRNNAMVPLINEGASQISEGVNQQGWVSLQRSKISPSPKGERSGLFMSLNSFQNYFNNLSNAISNFNVAGGQGNLNFPAPQVNSYKIRHYLNLLTKFDFKLSTSNYDYFQFKKSNNYLFAMEKATELLKLAFLIKGCLISKPIFSVVYPHNSLPYSTLQEGSKKNGFNLSDSIPSPSVPSVGTRHPSSAPSRTAGPGANSNKAKILIHLFYYIKTKGLLNKASALPREAQIGVGSSTFKGVVRSNNANFSTSDFKLATSFRGLGKDKFITSIYDDKFLFLSDCLTKLFNADIEFELVRLYQPYQDSNILVQFLNTQSYNKKFIKLVSRLFRKINIYKKNKFNIPSLQGQKGKTSFNKTFLNEAISFPSGVSGVNIKLAGRPINERIIPRFTVKRAQRGNFNRLNAKMIETSMFTDKSRKGAFNFTVRLSHIFR